MAEKWKEALKNGGPATVGMFGSGQWTVCYAAVKPYKAGFRSNHIDPNARHCMASDMIVHGKGGTLLGTVSLDESADSMSGELSGVAVCSPEDYGQAEPELASPGASRAATRRAWEPACRIRRTLISNLRSDNDPPANPSVRGLGAYLFSCACCIDPLHGSVRWAARTLWSSRTRRRPERPAWLAAPDQQADEEPNRAR